MRGFPGGAFRVLRECIGLLSTPRAASFRNDFDIKRFLVFVVASLPLISGAYSVGWWAFLYGVLYSYAAYLL